MKSRRMTDMIEGLKGPVLITGASGFIGANLARMIASIRPDVHLLVRDEAKLWRLTDLLPKMTLHRADLTDRASLFARVAHVKPRTIFHLAAHGAYPSQRDVEKIEATVLHGTMNLLDACAEQGFDVFVNAGSSSEYGFKSEPMKETDLLEPNSHYAVFKAAATQYCQYAAASKKMPIITLRPFSVYGFYEEPTRLVPTLMTSLLAGTCPPLVSPDTARDYVFIDDMVEACLAAGLRSDLGGRVYNIGSGKQTTLKDIVETAMRVTGAKVTPVWGSMEQRIWDQNIWQADVSKARDELKWSPRTGLEEGLARMMAWLKGDPYPKNGRRPL